MSVIRKFFNLVYIRKRQVPFCAQQVGSSSATAGDEQLDSITRRHIVNELRRTTGDANTAAVHKIGTVVVDFSIDCIFINLSIAII